MTREVVPSGLLRPKASQVGQKASSTLLRVHCLASDKEGWLWTQQVTREVVPSGLLRPKASQVGQKASSTLLRVHCLASDKEGWLWTQQSPPWWSGTRSGTE